MVTGVDVVREQLRVAAGGAIGSPRMAYRSKNADRVQDQRRGSGDGFRPTPGTLTAFDNPTDNGPGRVLIYTHVSAGETIPPNYDSLIAKVIVHARTRDEAIDTMIAALSAATIEGVSTTIPLHLAVLDSPEFRSGEYDTLSIPGWSA